MFHHLSPSAPRIGPFRAVVVAVALVLMPPFVALAALPMLMLLLPVALVATPFMIIAFFGGAHANQVESKNIQLWRPSLVIPVGARA